MPLLSLREPLFLLVLPDAAEEEEKLLPGLDMLLLQLLAALDPPSPAPGYGRPGEVISGGRRIGTTALTR